eukprot:scaffold3.g6346.t1
MNERGLALGGHASNGYTAASYAYQPESAPTAIAFPDLMAILLGRCSTVDEVAAFLESEEVQITTDMPAPAVREGLVQLHMAQPEAETAPLTIAVHVSVYDAAGEGALLEFEPGKPRPRVVRNVSVATNGPTHAEHIASTSALGAASCMGAVGVVGSAGATMSASMGLLADQPYPGGFSSAARFIRLSMLLEDVCAAGPWPSQPTWSAGYAGAKASDTLPAVRDPAQRAVLAQAEAVLRTVNVPHGAAISITQVALLRDHARRTLLYQTPQTGRWRTLNLTAIGENATAPLVLPLHVEEPGFEDVTAHLVAAPVPLGLLSEEQGRLLRPLVGDMAAA